MKKINSQDYNKLAQKFAPPSPLVKDCINAFWIGGLSCVVGQVITDFSTSMGADTKMAGAITSVTLIFLSALLTGLTLYPKLAKIAGAGTVVPITGFANSMVSPAIEYRSEGWVLGVGAKMFTIAGPVLVYGTLSGIIAGLIYYFVR